MKTVGHPNWPGKTAILVEEGDNYSELMRLVHTDECQYEDRFDPRKKRVVVYIQFLSTDTRPILVGVEEVTKGWFNYQYKEAEDREEKRREAERRRASSSSSSARRYGGTH